MKRVAAVVLAALTSPVLHAAPPELQELVQSQAEVREALDEALIETRGVLSFLEVAGESSQGVFTTELRTQSAAPARAVRLNLAAFHDTLEGELRSLEGETRYNRLDPAKGMTARFEVASPTVRLEGRVGAWVGAGGLLHAQLLVCASTGPSLREPDRCRRIVDAMTLAPPDGGLLPLEPGTT